MPQTPDRKPGVADEEGILFEETSAPSQEREMRYFGGQLLIMDARGMYNPRRAALELPMVNSVTGEIYTSCVDGEIYLME